MNSSTYPSNSATAANSATASPTASAPAATSTKASAGTQKKEEVAEVLRDKLSGTIKQLGQRWKGFFHLPNQLRRHPLATVLSSTAVLLAIGGSITAGVMENNRRKTFSYRFKRGIRRATNRLMSR